MLAEKVEQKWLKKDGLAITNEVEAPDRLYNLFSPSHQVEAELLT
jgi:hypothetical protein